MANGINKVILVGHLGRDPEIREFNNGKQATFTLATTESYKKSDGQRIDQTEWHNIVLWRGLAEIAEKYLHKGDMIYLEGKIRRREYEDQGQKKYFYAIQGDNFTILSPKKEGAPQISEATEPDVEIPPIEGGTDDLPF
ncbi:MAG TPA: single-stranded DNA-binding protein [Bacteroidales bacterium]|jgi:single-strand DNA-binding protein|nr:single-stranded DNA-binding protein [Bacteroidales bacterium]